MADQDRRMPFFKHLEELRKRIVVSLIAICIGAALALRTSLTPGYFITAPYFANGFITAKRKLSAQIIFIMTSTNSVPGISASRSVGFSSRRCMKNITAR